MHSLSRLLAVLAVVGVGVGVGVGGSVHAQERPFGIGAPAAADDIRRMDISISPDGKELPAGSGTAKEGAAVFVKRRCAACHGATGKEGPGARLVYEPGEPMPAHIAAYYPLRLWPFAPSIWDYTNRTMPYDRPGSLAPDEVYAVTAFLLFRNGIITETDVMDATTLPAVQMPNRAGYDPAQTNWKPGTPRGFGVKP